MNRTGILQGVVFFVYLFFQVLILKNAVLFHTAFCFLYVGYLLLLPVETNPLILMAAGFVMGFFVDVFYDSLGLHAMTCVLLMYARNHWLSGLTPQGGYDANAVPAMAANGTQWFLVYVTPMVFVHHSVLFFTESGGFGYFWLTLGKAFASTLYTVLVMVMVEFLFPKSRS